MKQIMCVFVGRHGEVQTLRIPANQKLSDEANLEAFVTKKLKASDRIAFDAIKKRGYTFSNWHVIEA